MKTINNSSEIYKQIVVSDDTLLSTSDYINDKVNDVYNQMLGKAISDFLSDLDHWKYYECDIKPIKDKNWKTSPRIIITSKKYPFKKKIVNIKEYWDKVVQFSKKNSESYSDLMIDEDTLKDAEIVSINYVLGIVKMRSKFTQVEFEVPFSKINGNTNMSLDCTLAGTFTYLSNK